MLKENNLCLLGNLCIYKSKKHYNPRYIWDKVLSTQIFEIRFYVKSKFNIYFQTLLVSISGTDISTKIMPVVHIFSLMNMTYLKMLIGIQSLNAKQLSARLSRPVKLSSFIGVKSPPPLPPEKKERVIYDCCLSLCL